MINTYEEYASIDQKIKVLTEQKEQLRGVIVAEMLEKGEEKIETAVGSFSIARRKTWTYPEKVLEIGEKFKAAKAKSESTGEATYTEEESLRFNQIKL